MPKYISREELIEALEADYNSDWDRLPDTGDYVEGVRDEYDDVLTIVCGMKATGVQPVKCGVWEKERYNDYEHYHCAFCSICGYESTDHYRISDSHKYCENCGARMDGDNNG